MTRFVDDWRSCYRWWSMRLTGAAAALEVVYVTLPARIHDDLPGWATNGVSLGLLAAIALSRVLKQESVK